MTTEDLSDFDYDFRQLQLFFMRQVAVNIRMARGPQNYITVRSAELGDRLGQLRSGAGLAPPPAVPEPEPERLRALRLAGEILDRPSHDLDDDLGVLARQLLRAQEQIDRLTQRLADAGAKGER